LVPCSILAAEVTEPVAYAGTCSASAAVALGSDRFVVADDESNKLRVYARKAGGRPLQVFDLASQLQLERRAGETDIEGAARLGDRTYWISSHGRNKSGREQPNRYRFFATRLQETNHSLRLSLDGAPYKALLSDLVRSPVLRSFNLLAASRRAPKDPGGLNIEGLCATPDQQLLIAFRNPIPGGRALLVPLLNPDEVCAGRPAIFGEALLPDLEGLGVRDIACWEGQYVIVAGSADGGGKTKLFTWQGGQTQGSSSKA
jgi:hypothetical protein